MPATPRLALPGQVFPSHACHSSPRLAQHCYDVPPPILLFRALPGPSIPRLVSTFHAPLVLPYLAAACVAMPILLLNHVGDFLLKFIYRGHHARAFFQMPVAVRERLRFSQCALQQLDSQVLASDDLSGEPVAFPL